MQVQYPSPFMGAYGATKHALEGWSKALDHELRPFGIRSFTVRPGFMRTRIAENAVSAQHALPDYGPARAKFGQVLREALGSGEDPAVVAETVSRALAARRRRTGHPAGRAARQLLVLHALMPQGVFDVGSMPGQGIQRIRRLPAS